MPVGPYIIIVRAPDYYTERQAVVLDAGDIKELDFRLFPIPEVMEQLDEGEGENIEGEEEAETPGWCRGCRGASNAPEDTKRLLGDWLLIGLSMLVLGSSVRP